MLRVTKLADYGIVILTHFATHKGVTHNARDIATEVRLPQPVVSKVLKLLGRYGLLVSQRGTKGGYILARQPEEITVADIIHAVEGPIAVTECSDKDRGDCGLQLRCPVRGNWHLINEGIREALKKITLAEMTQPLTQPLVSLIPPRQESRFHI